jgi:small ligand-binding sensory domain FIST
MTSRTELGPALEEAVGQLAKTLGGKRPHLLMVFFTGDHSHHADGLRAGLVERLQPDVLMGCAASGVIAGRNESQHQPGLVIWGAHWPGVELTPFALRPVHGQSTPALEGWPDPVDVGRDAGFLVLADPYSAHSEVLLPEFARRFPQQVLVGGLASSTTSTHEGRLLTTESVVPEGLVGVAVGGSVQVETVVSQGCRPVGHHFVITDSNQHMIHRLGGKPALEQLQATLGEADEKAQQLMAQGALHIGRVVDERKSSFGPGDFLVRNLLGVDSAARSIAISDHVRPGQTIQFMVRDPAAAHADLETLLEPQRNRPTPLGALMFTCNGRGSRFFGRPNHDVDSLHTAVGPVPTAGFFAAGEIGPVGGQPFLHGLTASIALFRERSGS